MTDRPCLVCERPMPTGDVRLACGGCWNRLERDLAQMPALLDELDATLARQGVSSTRYGGRSADKPLPLDLGASARLTELHVELASWIRIALDEHPPTSERGVPDASTRGLARQLLGLHGWLQTYPDGHLAITRVGRLVARAIASMDRRGGLQYAGVCSARPVGCPGPGRCSCACHDGHLAACDAPGGCGLTEGPPCPEELYLREGASVLRCPTCGTEHDAEARRAYLLGVAEDVLVTTTEACRAVSVYGSGNLSESTVRSWRMRHRLLERGHDADGRPLFRLGDITDLALGRDARGA